MNPLVDVISTGCHQQITNLLKQGYSLSRTQLSQAFSNFDLDKREAVGSSIIDLLVEYDALPKGVSVPLLKAVLSS